MRVCNIKRKKTSNLLNVLDVYVSIIFTIVGTAANATDSSSAASKSEVEGENKGTEEDDNGGTFNYLHAPKY